MNLEPSWQRWRWLVLAGGLASCAEIGDSARETEESLEIFSWWTSSGEAEALAVLFQEFERRAPDVTVVNVAAADPTRARDRLRVRVENGEPPDSFQAIAGADLRSWIDAGKMTPLATLATENDWQSAFPAELLEISSKDGELYAVPVNIERDNNLYFNVKLFAARGLEAPRTLAEFHEACAAFRPTGVVPLTVPAAGWVLALVAFETLMPAVRGGAYYRDFFAGRVDPRGPEAREFFTEFARVLSCSDINVATPSWTEGADRLALGQAAMYVMGDWVKGYWENGGNGEGTSPPLVPLQDFDVRAGLGSEGYFVFNSAVFGLPARSLHPRATQLFLSVAGSSRGQEAFNRVKGSVPARIDADLSDFDEMVRGAVADFKAAAADPQHLLPGYAALTSFDFQKQMNPALLVFAVGGARARDLDPASVPEAESSVPVRDLNYILGKLEASYGLLVDPAGPK